MYDGDHPNVYRTRCEIPSWNTVLHTGEMRESIKHITIDGYGYRC
jgi:hypothetical protein